ncbi:MAG: YcxB family protein [Flammeovirgaceae bacterium]
MVTFQVQLKWQEYRDFSFNQSFGKPVPVFLWSVGLLFVIGGAVLWGRGQELAGMLLVLLGGILIGFWPIITYRRLRETWRNLKPLSAPMHYRIDENQLHVFGDGYELHKNLAELFKIEEQKSYFLLYLKANSASMIPKRSLSAAQLTALQSIFSHYTQ